MSLKLIKDGVEQVPHGKALDVAQFCLVKHLDITFEWREGQFWLHSPRPGENPIGVLIDYEIERHLLYFKKSSLHKELLARAIGIKGAKRPKVVDLTAGLLGDSLLMLAMGCEVWAFERNPIVGFLMESALLNARHPLLKNLHFHVNDARDALPQIGEVDVLYFDPMFEDVNEKSLPRKEMRIFRGLVGPDLDAIAVFEEARELGVKRLVVKRPRLSTPIIPGDPLTFMGKATRYDVYLSVAQSPK